MKPAMQRTTVWLILIGALHQKITRSWPRKVARGTVSLPLCLLIALKRIS
jgi:hypothetical protein